MPPLLRIHESLVPCPCLPALVWAEDIAPAAAAAELRPGLAVLVERAVAGGEALWPKGVKERVRDMLRHGRYKPAGRGKPASEFLLGAAARGDFPALHPAVDANNAVSLESGFPGTIFDLDRSGEKLVLRRGAPGERYVFNRAGQEIDLQDLLLVARETAAGSEPCGNPVKDSMATKIQDDTRRVVAVLYAPPDEPPASVERWAGRYAELLREWCRARETGFCLVSPP